MVLVVGDLHGEWSRLNGLISEKQPELILQCGDFGWWPMFSCEKPVLYGKQRVWSHRGIKTKNTKIYWCDGNHEDHEDLKKYEEISEVYGNVFYCPRGSTLTLKDGRVVLFIGGAESIDKEYRIEGRDWFREEIISTKDLDNALLADRVDIVLSHTCPSEFSIITRSVQKFNDPSMKALSVILEKYKPSQWIFGHFHLNKTGKYKDTYWECLDYPGHGSKWWRWL